MKDKSTVRVKLEAVYLIKVNKFRVIQIKGNNLKLMLMITRTYTGPTLRLMRSWTETTLGSFSYPARLLTITGFLLLLGYRGW